MSRAAIFAEVRKANPNAFSKPESIKALDDVLDLLGVAREGAQDGTRRINAAGLQLIKDSEDSTGTQLTAYLCPGNVWTIGYGSTGPHVKKGMQITPNEAEALLIKDLSRFEKAVSKACPKATDNQFSAMVSLAFNIGEGAFAKSTVCRKHNLGDYAGAKAAFAMWNKSAGKVLRGLERRRAKEASLYGQP